VSNSFGLVIESLVALLLLLTIAYCILLNRQLTRLRADELSMRTTISELMSATEGAERAIAGLKLTVRDCDEGLGEHVRTAERLCAQMDQQFSAGEDLVNRLSRVAPAVQPAGPERLAAADPKAMVAAAQAFASRARSRVYGHAA
jgi:hypothetical protein